MSVAPLRGPVETEREKLLRQAYTLSGNNNWYTACEKYQALLKNDEHPAPEILGAYATCLMLTGDMEAAAKYYKLAFEHKDTERGGRVAAAYGENMIVTLDHCMGTTAAQALAERRAWYRRFSPQWTPLKGPHTNDPDPERPLRIGYVSGDFREHSACFAFSPVVLRHTPGVEVFCYHTALVTHPQSSWDQWTNVFSQDTTLRVVSMMTTEQVVNIIRRDKIDILVDLAAFTNWGRLDVFCAKPAPIQITGWGYCLGTGCDEVDVIMGDPVATPYSDQEHFTERIVHLPVLVPYHGPLYAPAVEPMPILTYGGHFTFGVFSRPAKINPQTLRLWSRVMQKVPGARMLVQNSLSDRAEHREYILRGMPEVSPERVMFAPHARHAEHLGAFNRIDLGLDCYPNSGGMTVLEGIWMGVPHLTLMGDRLTSRVAASINLLLGLEDFVARSEDAFVDLAYRWATEGIPHLGLYRMRLRKDAHLSPLIQGYPEAVEAVYRDLWRMWCKGEPVGRGELNGQEKAASEAILNP